MAMALCSVPVSAATQTAAPPLGCRWFARTRAYRPQKKRESGLRIAAGCLTIRLPCIPPTPFTNPPSHSSRTRGRWLCGWKRLIQVCVGRDEAASETASKSIRDCVFQGACNEPRAWLLVFLGSELPSRRGPKTMLALHSWHFAPTATDSDLAFWLSLPAFLNPLFPLLSNVLDARSWLCLISFLGSPSAWHPFAQRPLLACVASRVLATACVVDVDQTPRSLEPWTVPFRSRFRSVFRHRYRACPFPLQLYPALLLQMLLRCLEPLARRIAPLCLHLSARQVPSNLSESQSLRRSTC